MFSSTVKGKRTARGTLRETTAGPQDRAGDLANGYFQLFRVFQEYNYCERRAGPRARPCRRRPALTRWRPRRTQRSVPPLPPRACCATPRAGPTRRRARRMRAIGTSPRASKRWRRHRYVAPRGRVLHRDALNMPQGCALGLPWRRMTPAAQMSRTLPCKHRAVGGRPACGRYLRLQGSRALIRLYQAILARWARQRGARLANVRAAGRPASLHGAAAALRAQGLPR